MSLGQQLGDESARSVVGVGHQQHLAVPEPGEGEQQKGQLVEQGACVAVGSHQSLVGARDQGHGGHVTGGPLDQQGQGLERMPHDVFRLGVGGRLLVEQLDGGHLAALLGGLDAVGQADEPLAGTEGLKQLQTEAHPAGGEGVEIEPRAVEQVQEAVVDLGAGAEEAHVAGDAGPLGTAAEAHQREGHPQKGAPPVAGGTKGAYGIDPGDPEGHGKDSAAQ